LAYLVVAILLVVAAVPAKAFSHDILLILANGNSFRFNVELAISPDERAAGLMFRKELAPNAGMLFLYPQDQAVTFWMKNTYLPLDMVFIAADGKITQVVKGAKPLSEDLIPSDSSIRGVLELNAGITDQFNIRPGDQVDFKAFKSPAAANSQTP
jgi:hypothetical protein